MLRSFQNPLIFAAIDQILVDVPNASPPDDVAPLIKSASRLLGAIDAEDDLLYGAAKDIAPDVTTYYFAALSLQWYSAAVDFVEKKQKPGVRKKFAQLPITLHAIVNCLIDDKARSLTVSALNRLTSDLPARSHFDLLKKPFGRSGTLHAFPLLLGDNGLWNVSVREELITGGRIGKDLGKIWEEFYAKSFSDSDWTVLGEGVRLKEKGEVITDVDLLLLREDLLLVVQIKALTGSGATQYDHWKNRKIIEWGCEQARIATEHLRRNPHTITSIASKSVTERIKHIEPVVFTNGTLFDGWTHRGVTVAGNTVRNSLTEGSSIDYTDSKTDKVIDTHIIVDKNELTTEKILWLLRNPVELQAVADEELRFSSIKIGNRVFNVPDLELSEKAMTFREIDRFAIPRST